jgi:hypothetical protein
MGNMDIPQIWLIHNIRFNDKICIFDTVTNWVPKIIILVDKQKFLGSSNWMLKLICGNETVLINWSEDNVLGLEKKTRESWSGDHRYPHIPNVEWGNERNETYCDLSYNLFIS